MKILLLVLQFLPYALQAVKAVEESIGAGHGAAKKDLVMSAVQAAAKVGASVPEEHVAVLSGLVDSTVATLNASGIFKTSPATPPLP